MKISRHVLAGAIAGFVLLVFYFAVLAVANSLAHAFSQFFEMWQWVLALSFGFGVQAGLYSFIRSALKAKAMGGATAEVAASGGVSGGSMVACCAHHAANVLPLIGLSGAAIFLSQYQLFFILTGVFSNIIGAIMLLAIIQKHRLAANASVLKNFMGFDLKKARNLAAGISVLVLGTVFWLTANKII